MAAATTTATADSEKDTGGKRDLKLETLAGAINGDILVHIHCYRADEMATMLDLAKEFGFKVAAFHHGVEAYKLADRLAAEGVCGALWADWWGFKMEAFDGIQENIALVDRPAGGCAIVHSDSAEGIQRLNQEAAKVMAHAQPRRHRHRARTRDPLAHREPGASRWASLDQTGTLEPGKMADVVLWNGNPFSVYAQAEQVYIDGARVYDRNDPHAAAAVGLHARPGARVAVEVRCEPPRCAKALAVAALAASPGACRQPRRTC